MPPSSTFSDVSRPDPRPEGGATPRPPRRATRPPGANPLRRSPHCRRSSGRVCQRRRKRVPLDQRRRRRTLTPSTQTVSRRPPASIPATPGGPGPRPAPRVPRRTRRRTAAGAAEGSSQDPWVCRSDHRGFALQVHPGPEGRLPDGKNRKGESYRGKWRNNRPLPRHL